MKSNLPDFDNTPMKELIKERIQGQLDRQVLYDWLCNKMFDADIAAKYSISVSTVGRILRRGRAKLFR